MREGFIADYISKQERLNAEKAAALARKRAIASEKFQAKLQEKAAKDGVDTLAPVRFKKKKKKKRKKSGKNKSSVTPGDHSVLSRIVSSRLGKLKVTRSSEFWNTMKALGFDSYKGYLKSDLWKAVKSHVFGAKGRTCFLCDCRAFTVHHRKYTGLTLVGSDLQYLSPICNSCHQMIEFDVDGGKLESSDVEKYVQQHLEQNRLREDDVSREFREMFR